MATSRRVFLTSAVIAGMLPSIAACSNGTNSSPGATPPAGATPSGNVTVWNYGDITDFTKKLNTAFTTKYPDAKVDIVAQPGDQYFALLQAAVTSGRGPDVFTMFPGGYQTQFQPFSLDLGKYIPKAEFEAVQARLFAEGSNLDNPVYGVPLLSNMYYMLYNQDIFNKAGVAAFPTTWTELYDASEKIKKAGYLPLGYGNESGSGGFGAFQDFSYMSGPIEGLAGWDKLIEGAGKYDSPELQAQVQKWADLHAKGYTNPDVLTWRGVRTDFIAGKYAMYMTGSWDAEWASQGLGAAVHAAPAPFSDNPMNVLIRLQDSGLSVNAKSKNDATAAAYVAFAISEEGQKIVAESGGVPSRTGVDTTNPINKEILANAAAKKWNVMPMFDNFIDASVTQALVASLDQAMAGQLTASQALSKIDSATAAVPDAQRIKYNLAGK